MARPSEDKKSRSSSPEEAMTAGALVETEEEEDPMEIGEGTRAEVTTEIDPLAGTSVIDPEGASTAERRAT
jgi:fructose-1,6-bisphosphatase